MGVILTLIPTAKSDARAAYVLAIKDFLEMLQPPPVLASPDLGSAVAAMQDFKGD